MRIRNSGLFVLWMAAFISGCSAKAQEPTTMSLVRLIPLPGVEGRIDHLSLDSEGKRLFIAALGNHSVAVVDLTAGAVAGTIDSLAEPQGVFYIPESKKLAIACGGEGSVRFYDPSLKLLGKIDSLSDADNLSYDAKSKLLYAGFGEGSLAVIDPEKMEKVADIKLDGHPEAFVLEAGGDRIFVNVPQASEIQVVDRAKRETVARWPLKDARANYPIALEEEHKRLFVGCRNPAKVLVFDTQSGSPVAVVDCVGDCDDLFYDPQFKRLYVSGGSGKITVIDQSDGDHYAVKETIDTASGARTSIYQADAHTLYLAVPHKRDQKAEIRVYQAKSADAGQ